MKSNEWIALVAKLNQAISKYPYTQAGDERLLTEMIKYMPDFKTVMDNRGDKELDQLATEFPHFHRFGVLLSDMAQAISDGRIQP